MMQFNPSLQLPFYHGAFYFYCVLSFFLFSFFLWKRWKGIFSIQRVCLLEWDMSVVLKPQETNAKTTDKSLIDNDWASFLLYWTCVKMQFQRLPHQNIHRSFEIISCRNVPNYLLASSTNTCGSFIPNFINYFTCEWKSELLRYLDNNIFWCCGFVFTFLSV